MTDLQPHAGDLGTETKVIDRTSRRSRKQRRNSPTPLQDEIEIITSAIPASLTLSMAAPIRLLVCSIGNPGPYINTLHSAGHTILSALASTLSYPSFQKSRSYGNGLVSAGLQFTLWQSSSQMNISGVGVAAAWRQFVKDVRGEEAKLVVVHDELELSLGQVKVKSGTASPKGHNGLKSIREVLKGVEYTRIGVGIGRPESRDPDVVAGYVLRNMSAAEMAKVEGCVGKVAVELRKLGW
jgi:PTH1 family peptidyl-tRNA hydrolase